MGLGEKMGSLFGKDYQSYPSYYSSIADKDYNYNDNYNYGNTSSGSGNKLNKTFNDIFGIGKDMFGAYNSYGGGGYGGIIGGAVNSGMTALNGGSWKEDVPQSFFGIDDHKDSDVMQTLKGAGKGAMMGAPFGPIGMAVGALLGTGASFLDDI